MHVAASRWPSNRALRQPADCVVLTDTIPEASRTCARTLAEIARLVDVNDEQAIAEMV